MIGPRWAFIGWDLAAPGIRLWETGHGEAWQADADYIQANEATWAAALLG